MPKDNTDEYIRRYEAGELSDDETVEFFQDLIDSGKVWHLQGKYRRQAVALIESGLCKYNRHTGEA